MLKRDDPERSLRALTLFIYILYGLSVLLGFTSLLAFIVNLIKRKSTKDTIYASHFRWQIRTFLFSSLWAFVGFVITFLALSALSRTGMLTGVAIISGASIWYIYRIIKGLLYLNRDQPMYCSKKPLVNKS